MAFAQFKSAHKAGDVNYLDAEIRRAQIANQVKQQERAQRSANLMGGAMLYNEAMGDKSPITDYITDALRGPKGVSATPAPVIDKSMHTAESGAESFAMPDTGIGITGGDLAPTSPADMPLGYDVNTGMVDPALDINPAMEGVGATPDAISVGGFNPDMLEGVDTGAAEAALEGADAGGNLPIVSALRGADQLAQGDVAGAAGTGAKAWMSTLGPYGMGAAFLLGSLGLL